MPCPPFITEENSKVKKSKSNWSEDTKLTHAGRDPDAYHGIVNPPISRTSTILYPDLAAYENPSHRYRYGRMGNPMSDAFESAMAELESGIGAVGTQTGMAAITTSILSIVKSGDHVLMVDTVYPPTRYFAANILKRMNVEVEYYDPMIGADIQSLIRDNTSIIYLESPGSATFEIMDVPTITKIAKDKGITTILDNTYSAGILFKPLDHGVDISFQSCTKYVGGHSDINLGVIATKDEALLKLIRSAAWDLGVAPTAEDMYLALRGLRTLTTRMKQNAANALEVLGYMQTREEFAKLFHPSLETHKGHDIWKRDFKGANGLIGFMLQDAPSKAVHDFINALELFPIGSSWGGFESLCQPQDLKSYRTAVPWDGTGACFRLQVGLEAPKDLIGDLEQGLKVFNAEK